MVAAGSGDSFYEEFRHRIRAGELLRRADRVLAAVSGGRDSVALLHLLHRLAPELELDLRVASIDHGLRGERSRADQDFVAGLAREMGLELYAERVDAAALAREAGLSLEDAARRVRYEALQRVARDWGRGPSGPVRVAVGHTLDDQAETILMRITEGTGLDGLGGMPALRPADGWVLVRPLLWAARAQTRDYCRRSGLEWREDETNVDVRFKRNFIRAEIMPILRHCNPKVAQALAGLADLAREDAAALARETSRLAAELVRSGIPPGESPYGGLPVDDESVVHLPLGRFNDTARALRKRLVRRVAADMAGADVVRELGREGVETVLDTAAEPRVGVRLDLPAGLVLETGYNHLFLARRAAPARAAGGDVRDADPDSADRGPLELVVPGRTDAAGLGWVLATESVREVRSTGHGEPGRLEIDVDLERVRLPLKIRTRKPGDVFRPAGLGGRKKLKDFFISAKVPRAERDTWPLVVDAADRIVWVVGLRADERFQARGRGAGEGGGLLRIRAERAGDDA